MKSGILTFSFDDGRKDTFAIMKNILEPMHIPAVVYIPSGYIEKRYDNYLEIGYNGLMTKEELDVIHNNPLFEIGGHGYKHDNSFSDIRKGLDKLREWYPDLKDLGFASPHSLLSQTYVAQNLDRFKQMGISYVRGGRNFEKFTNVKRMLSLMARLTHSSYIFRQLYRHSMNTDSASYYIHAIPVHKLTTLSQIKKIVDCCVEEKCWAILEFHGIDKLDSKEYTEVFCWLEDDFLKLCQYACELREQNMLRIMTPLQVVGGGLL